MTLEDFDFVPQGTPDLNIQAFDCGRKSVNDFFHNEAQDYQDELFGKTYYWVLKRPSLFGHSNNFATLSFLSQVPTYNNTSFIYRSSGRVNLRHSLL